MIYIKIQLKRMQLRTRTDERTNLFGERRNIMRKVKYIGEEMFISPLKHGEIYEVQSELCNGALMLKTSKGAQFTSYGEYEIVE